MVDTKQTDKIEPMFLKATLLSLGVHFLSAVLLVFCLRANRLVFQTQEIITVDIRTLETGDKQQPKPIRQPEAVRDVKLKPSLPTMAHSVPEPARKPSEQLMRGTLPIQNMNRPDETRPGAAPLQTGDESPVKTLSPPERSVEIPKHANIPSPEKGTVPRNAEQYDVYKEKAYLATLREMIEEHKEYPLTARKGRLEGTVHISCIISRNGEIREVTIVRSSGYNILDNAAKHAVTSKGRYPDVPPQIKGDTFRFVSPITFRLTEE